MWEPGHNQKPRGSYGERRNKTRNHRPLFSQLLLPAFSSTFLWGPPSPNPHTTFLVFFLKCTFTCCPWMRRFASELLALGSGLLKYAFWGRTGLSVYVTYMSVMMLSVTRLWSNVLRTVKQYWWIFLPKAPLFPSASIHILNFIILRLFFKVILL